MFRKYFFVGRYKYDIGGMWEFLKIYTTHQEALENCKDKNCFVGPIIIDERKGNKE
jgi:hypothetical protein